MERHGIELVVSANQGIIMLFLLLQSVPAPQSPDIEVSTRLTAKSVTIEKQGDASLTVHANPDAGTVVDVQAPAANGAKTLRHVNIKVHARASIASPEGV